MNGAVNASDCARVFAPLGPMYLPPLPKRPLVSILISNYNYAAYLEAAVASSIEQTYDRLEVVVCDDGSTDASSEILSRVQARDQRIKIIRQQNGGQSLALNAAFQTCGGDVICLLDADDLFMPDKVRRVVDAFTAAPCCGLAVNRMLRVDRTRRYLGQVPLLSSLASGWIRPCLSLTAPHVAPGLPPSSGLSLRRHVAEALFPLPAGLRAYADTLIQILAPLLTPIVGIDTPLSEYRFHGANVAAVSEFTESKLRNLVAYEKEIWCAWRRFLASSWSGLPPDFHVPFEMPSSPMSYAYSRFRSRLDTHHRARSISSVYLDTWPRAHKWYWRAAPLLPDWLFRRSFAFVYGQTPAKIVLGRLLGVLRSISFRSRLPELIRRAVRVKRESERVARPTVAS